MSDTSDLVISFDIGIQNLAFCIFKPNQNALGLPIIIDWQCINILNLENNISDPAAVSACVHPQKNGSLCSSAALFIQTCTNQKYCKKHAQMEAREFHYVYESTHGPAKLERLTKIKLRQLCEQDELLDTTHRELPPKSASKTEWIQYTTEHFKDRLLCPLSPANPTGDMTSSQIMIQIGKNIKRYFDGHVSTPYIRTVLIENQIAPHLVSAAHQRLMGTTRMKMIQSILMEYFIVRGDESLQIDFVSSAHKLNQFLVTSPQYARWAPYFPNGNLFSSTDRLTAGALYRFHKKQAGILSTYLLDYSFPSSANPGWAEWKQKRLANRKKDDLDDAFLQGLVHFMTPLPNEK